MPNFDGNGGHGLCGGCGLGLGLGRGMGYGRGRGAGWTSVGYGSGGAALAARNMRTALEGRKAFLRAELARTEALLADGGRTD